ncbi:hypothetical protein RD110_10420 [Rhodoferax koreense]|uniref:Malonyl-CoA:ACP transacylase (MAT) domain-containing protein n=1 Tax=Rhodoferax koreensis TaxID=1842727 RepID=A0A1P8JUW8_9BURK|nr:acyltransferase domain-containing protein [Rhodoferax koreense]APW37547.1 hypothetical protein RD110_10420 [Rhodoferax koreense]
MSYAVLFPGQGSQHAAMLPWLEEEAPSALVLQAMAAMLGADWRQRLEDPDFLASNRVAQVLVTGVSLAAWAAVRAHLPAPPDIVAGYSVGELAAVACAGAFDAATALALAAQRAQAMDAAVQGLATGLLSVSGPNQAARDRLLAEWRVETAIRIAPGHVILAGEAATLQAVARLLADEGAHCTPLPIRVASHSSWMRAAATAFAQTLADVAWRPLQCAVAANATGSALRRPQPLCEALSRQIDHTVAWDACLETVAERRVERVIEIGPGRALGAMWAHQHPDVPVRSLEDFRSARSAADWVQQAA